MNGNEEHLHGNVLLILKHVLKIIYLALINPESLIIHFALFSGQIIASALLPRKAIVIQIFFLPENRDAFEYLQRVLRGECFNRYASLHRLVLSNCKCDSRIK